MEFSGFKLIRQLVQLPGINTGEKTGRVWADSKRLPVSWGFKTQTPLESLVDDGFERAFAQRNFLAQSFGDLRFDRERRPHLDILHHKSLMSSHLVFSLRLTLASDAARTMQIRRTPAGRREFSGLRSRR
jgi:hypothetical protein